MSMSGKKTMAAACVTALFLAAQLAPVAEAAKRGGGARGGGTHTNMSGGHRGGNNVGNRGGNTINRGDVNRHRGGNNNVNINGGHNNIDIDVDNGWNNGHWDDHWHPVATAAAVGATVAVTRAIVGTRVYVLPATGCQLYPYSGTSYYICGDDWYAPQYVGTQVSYVVVARPY